MAGVHHTSTQQTGTSVQQVLDSKTLRLPTHSTTTTTTTTTTTNVMDYSAAITQLRGK